MNAALKAVAMLSALMATPGCATTKREHLALPVAEAMKTWTAFERGTVEEALVNWATVSAPFGRILLIEDDGYLCAVRFTSHVRGGDAGPGSVWSSGEETLVSVYEWELLERSGDAVVVDRGREVAKRGALKGIGRFVFLGLPDNVKCGAREFGWYYPGAIALSARPASKLRLAPTREKASSSLRLSAVKHWFVRDEARKDLRIRVEDL